MTEITQKPSAHFSTAALALLEASAWTEEEREESGDGSRGKAGEGEGGGGGPLFKDLVKTVRGDWKHLIGSALIGALKDIGVTTRASANMMVSWTGEFTIVQDIFDEIEELLFGKDRERKRDWWKRWNKKGKSKTATPGR